MSTFLYQLANTIVSEYLNDTQGLCIVLPNKRGAVFLKSHLSSLAKKTIWLPKIISAEEMVSELSGLQQADSIDLICELYESYQCVLKDKAESFENFVKWGNIMLQDFNEIDRYLVDYKSLYQNLKEIKEIEHWSLSAEHLTETQQDYCNFMSLMGQIYEEFTQKLIQKKIAYQGLMYRKAVDSFFSSELVNTYSQFIIAGFNALNKSETIIFSELSKLGKARLFWDADNYYVNNNDHEAGLFLRRNMANQWLNKDFKANDFYNSIHKQIEIYGVPKFMGQAMMVHQKISEWLSQGKDLSSIAIVLADESLLFPVLNQLPGNVHHVNITMEYPLKYAQIYDLVESLLNLQLSIQKPNAFKSFYYIDIFHVLQNSIFKVFYEQCKPNIKLQDVIAIINTKNYVWFNDYVFKDLFSDTYSYFDFLFIPWKNSHDAINAIKKVISVLQAIPDDSVLLNAADKEYIHVFTKQFNRLEEIVKTHSFLNSLETFKSLYKQIIGTSSVPFIGEPLQGLQIMGVLETRTLDFENIIMLGVNEGVLPSGKTVNSFIPNDLKSYHNMPLYADKDAVYSYHFYRLLQRAKNVVLSYNIDNSGLGAGEKSRFITQLLFELKAYNNYHVINESILGGTISDDNFSKSISIHKTENILSTILSKISNYDKFGGLSPSALISYNHCSLKYFFRYGAGIKEPDSVEENIEANTQGTILHETLELLYKPFIGKVIHENDLIEEKKNIQQILNESFKLHFTQKESEYGKNYLQKKVLFEYVNKLVNQDITYIKHLKSHNQYLTIYALEHKLFAPLNILINGESITIYITGSADRIDKVGSKTRIIDYKSSVKDDDKFVYDSMDLLFTDSKYDKLFQLFMYAWMVVKNNIAKPKDIEPCIIPFRKFIDEPQKVYGTNEKGKKGNLLEFTEELLADFENTLVIKIEELFNKDILFSQTTNIKHCEYCAYKQMCNR